MTACPKCGGDVWNNVAKVRDEGWKGPLYKCKDESCGWLKWPDRAKAAPAPAARLTVPMDRGPKHTWPGLSDTYYRSLLVARKQVVALATALKLEVRMEDILSAAATIFIAASRDGVKQPEPEPEAVEV
jgi:hypothetical protein